MHNSSFFLRSLQDATQDISDTLVEVMDFARAVVSLKLVDDDFNLLKTLYTKVLDAVAAVKVGKESDQKHRLHLLQKTLLE
jgi:Fe-S-cluster formation regulator IscX/YfhJ